MYICSSSTIVGLTLIQAFLYILAVELFMRTGWLTGRDQQMFDLLFDNLMGGWNMLVVPCFSLYYSWADSWPGWSENPKTALTPFKVVLAGLPLLPEPRQQPRLPATPQPGGFSYLRAGSHLTCQASERRRSI